MMTKSQVISEIADNVGCRKDIADVFLKALVAMACREAKNGFVIPGLGKVVVKDRKARKGRNPATGETIKIPAKKVLKFRFSKTAKDIILLKMKKKKGG